MLVNCAKLRRFTVAAHIARFSCARVVTMTSIKTHKAKMLERRVITRESEFVKSVKSKNAQHCAPYANNFFASTVAISSTQRALEESIRFKGKSAHQK